MRKPALLALQDGSLFRGVSIGAVGSISGEVVFNTAMTGYQEILTDPSYARQIVTLTYPHIGNVGTNPEDEEAADIHCAGLVIRDLPACTSNFRSTASLEDYLQSRRVISIADIDTRRLTRILREKGAQNGCLVAGDAIDEAAALAAARAQLSNANAAIEAAVADTELITNVKIDPVMGGTGMRSNFVTFRFNPKSEEVAS